MSESLTTPSLLFHLAKSRRPEALIEIGAMLDEGADVDMLDIDGRTALVIATQSGIAKVARLMLDRGANPDGQPSQPCPLFYAATLGGAGIAKLLLERGANPDRPMSDPAIGYTPLMAASSMGYVACLDLLLRAGANPLTVTELGHSAMSEASRHDGYTRTICIQRLIAAGVDPNVHGFGGKTPLFMAASIGNAPRVDLLLSHRANIDEPNLVTGSRPIEAAIASGHMSICEVFIERGASLQRSIAGEALSTQAINAGHPKVFEALFACEASLEGAELSRLVPLARTKAARGGL